MINEQQKIGAGFWFGYEVGRFIAAANNILDGYCELAPTGRNDGIAILEKYAHMDHEQVQLFWTWEEVQKMPLDELTKQLHWWLMAKLED